MRATSERRLGRHGRGQKYRGTPGLAVVKDRHDYQGDEPAFVCGLCGARVLASRPRHAVGGGKAKPWTACGVELEVAEGRDALANLTAKEAEARQLVTFQQIAKRFDVSVTSIRDIRHRLPDPVAKMSANAGALLFDARAVEAAVRALSPRWLS